MPKSKVRKKPEAGVRSQLLASSGPATTSRALAPSPRWYPIAIGVVLVIGLAWLVVYYMTHSGTDPHVPFMGDIGGWNFVVGFGIMLVGLIMTVRWR